MFKNKKLLTISLLLINLIGSIITCSAESTGGNLNIDACQSIPSNICLTLSAPRVLNWITSDPRMPFIYDNSNSSVYFYSPSLGGIVKIFDARTVGTFYLDATMTDLISSTNLLHKIPYQNIGLLSYNNSNSSSLDGYTLGTSGGVIRPISQIDPDEKNPVIRPFTETDYLNSVSNHNITNSYFTFFTGSGATSNKLNIITPTSLLPAASDQGSYLFGIGLKIDLPANSLENLTIRDNNYSGTLTFTLTVN